MTYEKLKWAVTVVVLGVFLAASGNAQQPRQTQHAAKPAARPAAKAAAPAFQPGLEPRAIAILKATSARLAAAKSMTFTAVVSYESPSRLGPPLVYSTKSQVTMQRPDKLKVITLGDGPASEFYYNGKTMVAFSPVENLVAIADAPPTIDAALEAAFNTGAIYFPFTDVIVADPYKDIADELKIAFYIGQSTVVGDTTTDIVAYVTGDVFVQAWIGAQDKLPRRVYAIYLNDRAQLRHVLQLSDWQLDPAIAADAFASDKAASAAHIAFARPDASDAPGMKPPPKTKPARTQ
ncbi:hypothetical protein SAMN05446635_3312 [Burkholderia sp. OK233]|nr:hypothetical protein SAMN05446635_3312 [Burkholderia sp. OK233]